MPITASAKKALRKSQKRHLRNRGRKKAISDIVKKVKKAALAKNKEEAIKLLPFAYKTLDKMAKVGYLKKNTAARKKSRLAKLVNKLK